MDLTPVESSHIAAIGYLESDRVLLVRYKDGALYAWRDFGEAMWTALQSAPSKGAWLGQQRNGVCISKGGNAGNPSQPERHGAEQTAPLTYADWCKQFPGVDEKELQYCWERKLLPNLPKTPLNVIDEDADPCCRKDLTYALGTDVVKSYLADGASKPIQCRECGTQFYPEMIGANRYWRIKSNVVIVRR